MTCRAASRAILAALEDTVTEDVADPSRWADALFDALFDAFFGRSVSIRY
jgi:hypothetical protein